MKLSIIIPVHNEERFIEKTLKQVFDFPFNGEKEVIVVDDGSTDGTQEILENLKNSLPFALVTHQVNRGKGEAVKTGIKVSTGELLIIQDADLEYNPSDIPGLISRMNENISAVYGERSDKIWPERGFHFVLGAKVLTWLINILFLTHLEDAYTGYKLFNMKKTSKEFFLGFKSVGFEFEAEVTCGILKQGGRIIETPIHYLPRSRAEGKHIGWKDACIGAKTILRARF